MALENRIKKIELYAGTRIPKKTLLVYHWAKEDVYKTQIKPGYKDERIITPEEIAEFQKEKNTLLLIIDFV